MEPRQTVLIVAKQAATREGLTRWCLEHGFCPTAASHPRQALCAAANHAFDAAVIEQSLPETTGAQLSARLKRLVAGLRVLLLSGNPDGMGRDTMRAAGVDALVYLPCTREQIGLGLKTLLKKPQIHEKAMALDATALPCLDLPTAPVAATAEQRRRAPRPISRT